MSWNLTELVFHDNKLKTNLSSSCRHSRLDLHIGSLMEDKIWNSIVLLAWREKLNARWAFSLLLLFIAVFAFVRRRSRVRPQISRVSIAATTAAPPSSASPTRILNIVSEADLKTLMNNLDGVFDEEVKWDDVIDKRNNSLSYNAKCHKPKNAALTYISVTIFENCSVELLKDFYMDNEYRVQWDKTVVEHKQLEVDETNGTEIGRTVKKFPFLTPREYILAWRLWEGKENTFYCFTKECEHSLAPKQKKYVRVAYFRSGWRIRKVPGRNACEIKMVHQEDAGMNTEMAKLVFAKGIWSFVCKMDTALRKYTAVRHPQSSSIKNAVTLLQKVPPELDTTSMISHQKSDRTSPSVLSRQEEVGGKTFCRKPSKTMIANGLLLLGGVICLSRGHSSIGAKVAIACILKKLNGHKASRSQAGVS